jgi:hypothetical protein
VRQNRVFILVGMAAVVLACASSHKVRGPEGEEQARQAEELMEEAEHDMKGFEVDGAQKKLERIRVLLKDPHLQTHPDLSVLWDRFNQDEGDLEIARKDKIKHELALKVNAQEQNLERARGPLLKAMEDLDKPDLTQSALDITRAAAKKVTDALVPGKALEAQDPGYAEEAKHAHRLVEKSDAAATLAMKRLAYIGGPLADGTSGLTLSSQAKAEKDKTKREPMATEARTKLASCVDGTQKALQDTAALASTSVTFDGKTKTINAVGTACGTALKATDRYLALLAKTTKRRGKK